MTVAQYFRTLTDASDGFLSDYTNPDPDGDGIAFNGKPIFTVEGVIDQLNPRGNHVEIGPDNRITYTFLDHAPAGHYNTWLGEAVFGVGSLGAGFEPFTEEQRDAAREAIGLWDDLIAPSFVEVNGSGAADIVYMNTNTGPAQAAAFAPWNDDLAAIHARYNAFDHIQGNTFINQDQPDNFDLYPGGYGFTTLVHETGHAIGLSHPGNYNFGDDEDGDGQPDPFSYGADAVYFQDSQQYTIMSYFQGENTGAMAVSWNTGFFMAPQTPMLDDIAAVQAIYGADMTTRTGDTTYGFNSNAGRDVFDFNINEAPYLTIYDAGGHDTLDFSGWTVDTVLDLNDGAFSSGHGLVARPAAELNAMYGIEADQAFWDNWIATQSMADNIAIAYGTIIEDGITGSGNDRLIGNEVDNRLDGGDGQDVYTGGEGSDTFVFAHLGEIDVITDFASGEDVVDLSAYGIDESNLQFVGNDVYADVNGDGIIDFAIHSMGDAIQTSDILFG